MINSKFSKNAEGVGHLVKPRWRIYALISVVGLIITGILSYGFYTGDRMSRIYAPLVDATMEIKLEATIAHLWFEEIVTGDRHEELETVWKHLDAADWYAKAMLEGGENPEGIFISLDNNKMRREIRDVQEKLMAFRDITKKRIAAKETSGIGTPIDQTYDKVFRDFFNQTDQVESSLQKIMTEDLSRFRYIQVILIAISLLLFLSIIMAFYHFDHRRIKDFVSIKEMNKNLELEIDERKQAEEALRESKEKFRTFTEMAPVGVFVTDADGLTTYWNKRLCEITGMQVVDGLGTGWADGVHPDDRDRVFKEWYESTEKRASFRCEYRFVDRDGAVTYTIGQAIPLTDASRRVTGYVGTITDVTDLKQAEEVLRESEQKYRTLSDSSLTGVFINQDSKYVFVNDRFAQMHGYEPEELLGKNYLDLIYPDQREIIRQRADKRLRGENVPQHYEIKRLKKDGEAVCHEIMVSGPITYRGRPAIMGHEIDISDRMAAEEAVRKSEEKLARSGKMEAMGLMAGGVAHDLNNILSGVVSLPELLLMNLPEDSPIRKPIKTIQESGMRAADVVEDLMTIARGVASSKEPLNFNTMVEEYLKSAEHLKLERTHSFVSFKTELDPTLLNMSGSPTHIKKILMNLVANVSEAIEGSGTVTISTLSQYLDMPLKGYEDVRTGEYAVVTVLDDGSGISPGDLERIFEPFYTKKVMGRAGTGLGLAVVWNTTQDYNGYINVNSSEKGTTFELYFPVIREEVAADKEQVALEDYLGHGENILVVDDDENQREIASGMLTQLGYKAESVSSGEDAIEYIKEHSVDLIVLDMVMPKGINGRKPTRQYSVGFCNCLKTIANS